MPLRKVTPSLLSAVLLAFLLTRAVVPAGFMPSGTGALGFNWCPSQSAEVIRWLNALPTTHAHHHHHTSSHPESAQFDYCDFAWLSALLVSAKALLGMALLSLTVYFRLRSSFIYRTPSYWPPSRAPPSC